MVDTSHPGGAERIPLFAPKLITIFREGYRLTDLRADALAGLTVAIVALPLSMAIAIASGVGPERGLITAIVGGFLVSVFGGSRFQIGGPAGAFIVLVSACVASIGLPGLIVATFLSGFILATAGLLRLGGYVRFLPYPVTLAFTAGIALIILASQVKDLLGLTLGHEPAALLPKLQALWVARETINPAALALAGLTIALILILRRLRPRWPGLLMAIAVAAFVAWGLGLPVETIGSRFGALPRMLPAPVLPDLTLFGEALPWAASFALLGAIESLLSAVVADGMSGRLHRPDTELIGQGIANIGAALFGGFCVTGTIARTATNVRAGSRGPVSGMLHALFLLAFLLIAAPLAAYIPLAALAGLLAVIAWSMAEKAEIWALIRASRADAVVIVVTFLLVVFRDLTEGIVAGFALGGLVFIRRMAGTAQILTEHPEDAVDEQTLVVRLQGPWFFGAAALTGAALDRIADHPRRIVLDFAAVPLIDSSGARTVERLAQRVHRMGGELALTATRPEVRRLLAAQGLAEPKVRFFPDIASARKR
ncbi:SulP family inorganic anion transporter [Neogemmobacter tilapiae]|uniref:Sodium-independent anion transporter n=1 Tax=Neogemmobacter tilapiae TaxID=875041 RepID=A0A918TRQ1_9RHOB|nr:SulP family inorganic anion transporter [Gemmobacter tilapiae]GHC53812.1 sodium-independent anion transporter [Gemmobacter tilapiae]